MIKKRGEKDLNLPLKILYFAQVSGVTLAGYFGGIVVYLAGTHFSDVVARFTPGLLPNGLQPVGELVQGMLPL